MNSLKTKWSEHLQQTKNAPPSPLLMDAVLLVAQKDWALDLGAGGLKDTRYLLSQGFKMITIVDSEPSVTRLAADLPADRIQLLVKTFDSFDFPERKYDLVNAQYALPFNSSRTFDRVITSLKKSLKVGGIFCGQLFGDQDEWNTPETKLIFYTKDDAKSIFADMELICFEEKIRDSVLANGKLKHWHLFNIIAKKTL